MRRKLMSYHVKKNDAEERDMMFEEARWCVAYMEKCGEPVTDTFPVSRMEAFKEIIIFNAKEEKEKMDEAKKSNKLGR